MVLIGGRLLIALICGSLVLGRVRFFSTVIVRLCSVHGRSRCRHTCPKTALSSSGPVCGGSRRFRSTGLWSQHKAFDRGWLSGGTDHNVIEMSTIQQLRNHVASRTGSDVGDYSLAGIRRDLKVRSGLLPHRLQHVCERGIVGHDCQLTAAILDTRRHGGHLIKWQRLKWSWGIGRERWGRGLFLLRLFFL